MVFNIRTLGEFLSSILGQKFSIRHDYKTNSWILEKPGNSWKILENIWTSEAGFIPDLLFIPDFIINSRILQSQAPTNHPRILLDILYLANLNGISFFLFLWFGSNKLWVKKRNKSVLGVISVRKKKYSEQMMKVHLVIVLNVIEVRKKNNLGGKNPKKISHTGDKSYLNRCG